MEMSSLCMVLAATLSIQQDKSQFFRYDSISLICAAPAKTSGWTLRQINSSQTPDPCLAGSCTILNAMPSDTGVYMCQSDQGGCSNTVNITVAAGSVILEMSPLPVTAGDTVALRCVYKKKYSATPSSAFEAMFYKDNVFIGTEPTGERILRSVSNLDAGFYGCEHPKEGKSSVSWLTVRDGPVSTSRPPVVIMSLPRLVCTVLLVALFSTTSILCVYVHCKWTKAQQKARSGTI